MAAAAILDFCRNSNNSAADWRKWMKYCSNVDGCYRKWNIWPKWTKLINSRWRRPPFWLSFIAYICTKFGKCITFEILQVQGSCRRRASKTATPLKVVILPQLSRVACKRLQIGTDMLLIITSNSDKLFINVNVDNFKWPQTPKIEVFSDFFAIFSCKHILRVNCAELAGDGPGQPAYDIFSIERTFLRI